MDPYIFYMQRDDLFARLQRNARNLAQMRIWSLEINAIESAAHDTRQLKFNAMEARAEELIRNR